LQKLQKDDKPENNTEKNINNKKEDLDKIISM
jgi:hypothetical protein